MYFLIGVLLLIVIVFGVSSGMQSYATAQQARAQIEVAQVAQVSAWGNLVTILTLALLVVVAVAVIAVVVWLMIKRSNQRAGVSATVRSAPREIEPGMSQQKMLEQMIQLKMLEVLTSSSPRANDARQTMSLPAPQDEPVDELPTWLTR